MYRTKIDFFLGLVVWGIFRFIPKRKSSEKGPVLFVPCDCFSVWGSRGDEAMIFASVEELKRKYGFSDFRFFTTNVNMVSQIQLMGFRAILINQNRFFLLSLLLKIKEINPSYVLILGADCMDGYYSPSFSAILMLVADFCACRNINYSITGFSFNENPSSILSFFYKICSNKVVFNLRDRFSLNRFKKFTGKQANLVADVAFLLKPNIDFCDFNAIKSWIEIERTRGRTVVGFNFHPMMTKNMSKDLLEETCNLISKQLFLLLQDCNISLLFIPHDNRGGSCSDIVALKTISKYLFKANLDSHVFVLERVYAADEIKGIVSMCNFLISSRMHLAIAALGSGVPVLCGKYQGKFEGLFDLFELSDRYLLTLGDFTSQKLYDVCREMLKDYSNLSKQIKKKLYDIEKMARQNIC